MSPPSLSRRNAFRPAIEALEERVMPVWRLGTGFTAPGGGSPAYQAPVALAELVAPAADLNSPA
ncbi:hypothetical protein, partial [Escherichia coli]|uniref:hypothetical protein n=1 Tax=Escherichia coli TaxID=562 RepID=UPI002A3619B9